MSPSRVVEIVPKRLKDVFLPSVGWFIGQCLQYNCVLYVGLGFNELDVFVIKTRGCFGHANDDRSLIHMRPAISDEEVSKNVALWGILMIS